MGKLLCINYNTRCGSKPANIFMGVTNLLLTLTLIGLMGCCAWNTKPGGIHDSAIGEALSDIYFGISIILLAILLSKFIIESLFIRGVILERPRIINIYVNFLVVYCFILVLAYMLFPLVASTFVVWVQSVYFMFNIFSILLGNGYYDELRRRQELSTGNLTSVSKV